MGELGRKSLREDALKVLAYLNEKTGRKFRESEPNISIISARLKEKDVTIEGVIKMIDRQVAKWTGTEFEEFLRPETLFGAKKFGSYYDMRDQPLPSTTTVLRDSSTGQQNQNHNASIGDLKRAAAILVDQIGSHPANREFIGAAESPTADQKADLKMRREKLAAIQAQIANAITT